MEGPGGPCAARLLSQMRSRLKREVTPLACLGNLACAGGLFPWAGWAGALTLKPLNELAAR